MKRMIMPFTAVCRFGSFALLFLGLQYAHAERLTHARFQELIKELRPANDAPWRTIPWKIALLDAQRSAAKQNKPIFIWAMDGHPLGCT